MDFDATLDLDGATATGITVPPDVVEALGGGRRPRVVVTVNGVTFATTIGTMKGLAKIPVSAERRGRIGAEAGDLLRVSVEVDSAPVELAVPADFATALAADEPAAGFFAGLTVSQRKGFIVPIEEARTDETRARRVDKAMTALRARQKRP